MDHLKKTELNKRWLSLSWDILYDPNKYVLIGNYEYFIALANKLLSKNMIDLAAIYLWIACMEIIITENISKRFKTIFEVIKNIHYKLFKDNTWDLSKYKEILVKEENVFTVKFSNGCTMCPHYHNNGYCPNIYECLYDHYDFEMTDKIVMNTTDRCHNYFENGFCSNPECNHSKNPPAKIPIKIAVKIDTDVQNGSNLKKLVDKYRNNILKLVYSVGKRGIMGEKFKYEYKKNVS